MFARIAYRVVEFLKKEEGPTAVEYAVLLGLIIVACLVTITALGTAANGTFGNVGLQMAAGPALLTGIADGDDGLFTLLMAQAIYVAAASDDQWAVGCTFTPKLREEILAWLEKIGREE